MLGLIFVLGVLGADATLDNPASAPPTMGKEREHGVDALGLPLVSFNSDTGIGYGAAGGAFFYAPGFFPFRAGLSAQVFFTSKGQQNHFLQLDFPKLFAGLRTEGRFEFRRDLFEPYYGAGNQSSPGANIDTHLKQFSYDRIRPAAFVRFRARPFGPQHPLQPYFGLRVQTNVVRTYENSLLAAQQPLGISGGFNNQLVLGALWDTRDDENDTHRGGMEEVVVRVSDRSLGSRYRYVGFHLEERRFVPVGRRLVVAERVAFDALVGAVPFYEWIQFGGISDAEGLGGLSSVRGVPLDRYGGNLKAFSNTELRFEFLGFPLLGVRTTLGGLATFDFGRTWQPGLAAGPWYAWHSAAGGGLRLARRAAVVRFDWAVALDDGRQALYVAFGQLF